MRAPLSWLRDFAPFPDDLDGLRAALDDLGLVVEGIEHVGEGLDDVVVSRVLEIAPIKGADRIRRVVVDAGAEPLEIVCGAHNFAVGDRVPLAPVGAILPGASRSSAQDARRHVQRHAVLGQGARALRRRRRPPGPGRRGAGRAGDAADGGARAGARHRLRHHRRGQPARRLVHRRDRRDLAARLSLPFSAPEPPEPATERLADRVGGNGRGGVDRPVPPPDRVGPRRRRRRAVPALDRPPAPHWPGCGPSTTWSTRRTT